MNRIILQSHFHVCACSGCSGWCMASECDSKSKNHINSSDVHAYVCESVSISLFSHLVVMVVVVMAAGVTRLPVFPAIHFSLRPIQSKCKYLHAFVYHSIYRFFYSHSLLTLLVSCFSLSSFSSSPSLFLRTTSTYSTIFIYIMWHVHVQIFAYQNRFQTKCGTVYEIGLNLCVRARVRMCVCACVDVCNTCIHR